MTAVTDSTRANHLGSACPPWCTTDHAALTREGKPRTWHASGRRDYLDAAGTPGSASTELHRSGIGAARPSLRVGGANEAVYSTLDVRCSEDAFALSVVIEAAGAMDDATRAAFIRDLRDAAQQLPLDCEL